MPPSSASLRRSGRRHWLIAATLLVADCARPTPEAAPGAQSRVIAGRDERVELLAIVFRLAGNSEYNQCQVPAYSRAIDAWFAPYRDHPAINAARALARNNSMGFDGVMSLAVHLGVLPGLSELRALDEPGISLDARWRGALGARPFVAELRQFVVDARVQEFFRQQQPTLDSAAVRLSRLVQTKLDGAWFEQFYGPRPNTRFHVVSGTCNGGANYGPHFNGRDASSDAYAIVGAQSDSAGWPVFRESSAIPLTVHEFNHSFVNPTLDPQMARMEPAGQRIYSTVSGTMGSLAYSNWRTMINESVVRAAAARYQLKVNGRDAAQRAVANEVGVGFIWTPEVFELLGRYEAQRGRYPAFESFTPEIIAYFNGLAGRVDSMVAAFNAKRPLVLSISPANGDTAVPPTLQTMTIRFDRPMGGGWSFDDGRLGNDGYPDIDHIHFDSTRTVLTSTIVLKPNTSYEFVMNGRGFRSAEGIPLGTTTVRFRTRAVP